MGKTAEFRCHKAKWETSSWKSLLEALVSCKYVFYQWRTFCLQKNWFFPASIPPHPVDGSNYGFWTEDDCLTSETESINLSLRVFISLVIHCYEQIKRSCITMMFSMMKWTCTLNASFWLTFRGIKTLLFLMIIALKAIHYYSGTTVALNSLLTKNDKWLLSRKNWAKGSFSEMGY